MTDTQVGSLRRWLAFGIVQLLLGAWYIGKGYFGWGLAEAWIPLVVLLSLTTVLDSQPWRLHRRALGAGVLVTLFQFLIPAVGHVHDMGLRMLLLLPVLILGALGSFLLARGGFEATPSR